MCYLYYVLFIITGHLHEHAGLVQFRVQAYQLAAACVSMNMGFSFTCGMPFSEVHQAFRQCKVLTPVAKGTSLTLTHPVILVQGRVRGVGPSSGQHSCCHHSKSPLCQSVMPPPQHEEANGNSKPSQDCNEEPISPPALLERGLYPTEEECTVCFCTCHSINIMPLHMPLRVWRAYSW
jgi:hypothetical protein